MFVRRLWLIGCTAAVLTGVFAGTGSAQAPDDSALRGLLTTTLNDFLTAQGPTEHISAASLRVTFGDGRPAIELPVGTTRYGGGQPIAADSLWQIGSNTKAFTAVMLLQLEAEHRLSINDRLGRWLPRYRQWRHIRIRQLLDMTSGIPDYTSIPAFLRDYAADPDREFAPSRLVRYAVGRPLKHGYYYSNTAYILAQMILEKVTRHSYAHELRARIVRPLRLRSLFYRPDPYPARITDRLPAGYFFVSGTPHMAPLMGRDLRRKNLSYAAGAGGIVSSLEDLSTWERALYAGRLLPPAQQRELETLVSQKSGRPVTTLTAADPEGYGLGVAQAFSPSLGSFWYYEGETFAFRVLHLYLPGPDVLVDLAVNSSTKNRDDKLSALGGLVIEVLQSEGAL